MSVYTTHLKGTPVSTSVRPWVGALRGERDRMFTLIMLGALVTFELFNFSTTEYALKDLLGDLRLGTAQWATILALAFSAVDFAGVAWLFTPKKSSRVEAWYLVAAWLLAATMNAMLTWWSVSLALLSNGSLGNEVISRETLLSGAPVFVALLIWLLRVLLIGSLTLAARRPVEDEPLGFAPLDLAPLDYARDRRDRRDVPLDSAPLDLAPLDYARDRRDRRDVPFGRAQGRPFGRAQGRPFGRAQARPFGRAQGRRDELRSSTAIGEFVPTSTEAPARDPARRTLIALPIRQR